MAFWATIPDLRKIIILKLQGGKKGLNLLQKHCAFNYLIQKMIKPKGKKKDSRRRCDSVYIKQKVMKSFLHFKGKFLIRWFLENGEKRKLFHFLIHAYYF